MSAIPNDPDHAKLHYMDTLWNWQLGDWHENESGWEAVFTATSSDDPIFASNSSVVQLKVSHGCCVCVVCVFKR